MLVFIGIYSVFRGSVDHGGGVHIYIYLSLSLSLSLPLIFGSVFYKEIPWTPMAHNRTETRVTLLPSNPNVSGSSGLRVYGTLGKTFMVNSLAFRPSLRTELSQGPSE